MGKHPALKPYQFFMMYTNHSTKFSGVKLTKILLFLAHLTYVRIYFSRNSKNLNTSLFQPKENLS